ncbi:MAG: hypothetical protein P8Q14_00440, partial [Vicingaceae bacterium]|nr:hypothetical protein [Vicingaceae bacterium]
LYPFFFLIPFSNKVKTRGVYYETTILGVRGEEVFLRIVEFENKEGKRYKSWVSIWTSLFIVRDVEWEIKLDTVNNN